MKKPPTPRPVEKSPDNVRDLRIARGAVAHYEDPAYYDFTYRRRREDVRFYVDLACEHRDCLELGVGTGRVALQAVQQGATVTGVERVPEMLHEARRKAKALPSEARARLTLRSGDIRKVRLGKKFPLVISPFNVFMHLYTRSDIEQALATVRAHLKPRGAFVFDVSMPDLRSMVRRPGRLYRSPKIKHPTTGKYYDYFESFEYDALREVQMVSIVFQNMDELDDLRITPLSQRQFFPQELEALLHYNGFSIDSVYGDFDGNPLGADSESQIVTARAR